MSHVSYISNWNSNAGKFSRKEDEKPIGLCACVAGNRQSDPKDERRRSQMAAARQVLERSTLMLLVSSKTSLR